MLGVCWALFLKGSEKAFREGAIEQRLNIEKELVLFRPKHSKAVDKQGLRARR